MRFTPVLACVALLPLLAAAKEPVRLQPSSNWDVDYAEDSCRLIRTFGEGKDKTVLVFESEAPGHTDLLVVGRPLEDDQPSDKVPGRFLPMTGKPMLGKAAESSETKVPAVLWSDVPLLPDELVNKLDERAKEMSRLMQSGARPPAVDPLEVEALKAARHDFASKVTGIEIGFHRPVILETGPLADAMTVFNKCGEESLRDWGVDPAVEAKIVRRPWARNPRDWFTAEDYPQEEVRKGAESEVKVRLLVDVTGKPTKCTSLSHFKDVAFNQVVCDKFMKRARFEPAELSDGTKVPSYYVNRVVFRIAM
jgi:hypothetical protein